MCCVWQLHWLAKARQPKHRNRQKQVRRWSLDNLLPSVHIQHEERWAYPNDCTMFLHFEALESTWKLFLRKKKWIGPTESAALLIDKKGCLLVIIRPFIYSRVWAHALFACLSSHWATTTSRLLGPTICPPRKNGGVPLNALAKDTTSKLAGLFSTLSLMCWAPSREVVNNIF